MLKFLFFSLFVWNVYFSLTQLSEDKSFNNQLRLILSRNVDDIFVKDIKIDSNVFFIDSREKKEYEVSHLKNAIWIGYDDFDLKRLESISKNSKLIVYCTVGYRSEIITKKLNKAGYKNVKSMIGGILEWKNLGNKVYDIDEKETEKVHTYDKSWGVWLKKGIKIS